MFRRKCLVTVDFNWLFFHKVIVHYPSGKKTSLITSETHKKICTAIARGTNADKVVADHLSVSSPMEIARVSAKIVKKECQVICKMDSNSLLHETSHDMFFNFTWEKMIDELKKYCPGLLTILSAVISDDVPPSPSKKFRHLMCMIAVGLHGRQQLMSLVQHLMGYIMMHGGCTDRNIERLAQIGMSVHPKTIHNRLLSWESALDTEILAIRDSWCEGGSLKYQLVGDNWDKNILPSYRTSERKTQSLHLFNVYAIVDRVSPVPSHSFSKVLQASEIDVSTFIPSETEQEQLMDELQFIFATSVIRNIPGFEQEFKDYPKHLDHPHSNFAGEKTKQFSLGLFDCNENLTHDVIELLAHSLDKYVPTVDGEIVESVFLGGDRLTDERVQGAQTALKNASTPRERLEGFISKTEDFHRLMNFLEAIAKLTYSTKSSKDRGTVYYYKNLLNARNVKGQVRNAYRAYKMLYYTILDALCYVLFLHHFDVKDLEGEIPFPGTFDSMRSDEKVAWLNRVCNTILRHWFFDDSTDIYEELRDIVTDPEHPENYWLSNLQDGRIKCHFCAKTYAYVGSLIAHEKKAHKVEKAKPKSKAKKEDLELKEHIIMLFKLLMLHKNLDTAVDMGDGHRSVRSAKYELPVYNYTNKVKYTIGSIHLTALASGVLPSDQKFRLIANRFVNLQGGKNNNIALDEFIEMLNRDSKIACSGHKTKESIIKHSKEYPHLTQAVKHYDAIADLKKRKGFHHLPSYKTDVLKIVRDLLQLDIFNTSSTLLCKDLAADSKLFDKTFASLSTMIHRHKPNVPYRRLRDPHY